MDYGDDAINELGEFWKDLQAKNNCNILNLSSEWDILKNGMKSQSLQTTGWFQRVQ